MKLLKQFARWQSTRRWLLVLTCAVGMTLGIVGCQRPASLPVDTQVTATKEVVKVSVIHPQRQTVRRMIKRPGYNIEAYQTTLLFARITGYVSKWNFDIGDRVRKNQVMAELAVPEMEVELQHKEAAVIQAEAEVPLAQAAVQRAQAELDRAKSQSERLAKLGTVINRENIDEARLGFESAQATFARAEAEVKVAKARLEVARKSRDYAHALLQYAKIRAPFDGVVTQRNINEGDYVHPGAGKKAEALFVVEQVDPVRVFVNIPDLDAIWVRDGAEASVRMHGQHGHEFKGTVTRTARSLNPATRTLRTEIDLPNSEGKLLPGMYVDVAVIAERRDTWTLPMSAVATEQDQSFCYQLENGKAVRTPLRLGLAGDKLVEVLKKQTTASAASTQDGWEDFTGKEKVIADGVTRLKDGQEVNLSASTAGK